MNPEPHSSDNSYYRDKVNALQDLFGAEQVAIGPDAITVDGQSYPVIDDVIIALKPHQYSYLVAAMLRSRGVQVGPLPRSSTTSVQESFGREWSEYREIRSEHTDEFEQYFDLIDLESLGDSCICDLGCGSGRWSVFLAKQCRRLILVDFSDAIFVARENLRTSEGAIFVMADLTELPFRQHFADLIVCLGVLHHLAIPALDALIGLKPYADRILAYLYYSLDNRPIHFRAVLSMVTHLRRGTTRLRAGRTRSAVVWLFTLGLYVPLIGLGHVFALTGKGALVPLYETYRGKSIARIRQDVYDRFLTPIEQRVSRKAIEGLGRCFAKVTVSPNLPYWHFLCES